MAQKGVSAVKPYYDHGGIIIYHGDAREVLPTLADKSVALVCTDPPYGLSYNNGDLANHWEAAFGGDVSRSASRPIANDATPKEAADLLHAVLIESKRLLVKGGYCCCCCCGGGPQPLFARWTLMMDEIIGFKHAVVWDKGGLGMGIHFRRNYEFVLVAQNGAPAHAWNGGKITPNVWRIPKIIPSASQHPTEKPVELMAKCIALFTNPNDLVLEPFVGTGATLVAAKSLGRRAIGIEIEEKYIEIAIRRLAQEVLPL
jgi:site-specific DNA-methyltransferase (adenine-specific)